MMTEETQEVKEKAQIPVPSELQGKDLGTSPKALETNQTEGVIPIAETCETASLDSYAQHLHSYVREYISVADRKASFVFTIGAALLVYLNEKGVVNSWFKNLNTWTLAEFIIFVAVCGLSLSCILGIAVVFPRLSGSKRGYIFWESIAEFASPTEFSDSAQKLDGKELTRELLKHSHELSKICRRKYRILNWSLRTGAVGAIATILYVVKG